jgi:hypothetical protein
MRKYTSRGYVAHRSEKNAYITSLMHGSIWRYQLYTLKIPEKRLARNRGLRYELRMKEVDFHRISEEA